MQLWTTYKYTYFRIARLFVYLVQTYMTNRFPIVTNKEKCFVISIVMEINPLFY